MTSGYLKNHLLFKWIICLVFILTSAIMGCASVSTVIEKTKDVGIPFISSSDSILKKKVGMVHLEAGLGIQGDGLLQLLQDNVTEYLSTKCNDILLISPNDARAPWFLSNPPIAAGSDRVVDNMLLAESSRENGFNACVVVTIADVKVEEKKSGFVWFKDIHETARIRIRVDVYGARTGAKILFEDFIREVGLEPGEKQLVEEGRYSQIESVHEAVMEMSKDIGKKICRTIGDEPWRGFVVAVENGKAVISAGSDVGIKVGDVFEVQGIHGAVEGPDGTRYRIPGVTIGEIEIIAVSPGQSRGISVSGKEITVGNTIQIRKK